MNEPQPLLLTVRGNIVALHTCPVCSATVTETSLDPDRLQAHLDWHRAHGRP